MELKVGLKYISKTIVDTSNTADAVGSGNLSVFSTPSMIALMENAAMNAVNACLQDGQTTVGSNISVSHLAPSKVGESIEAVAELVHVEGRKLEFSVEAFHQDKLIGAGTHIRFIVDKVRFMK